MFRITTGNKLDLVKQQVADLGASSGTVQTNVLTFVGVTYDGSTVSYYTNGVSAGTASSSQTFSFNGCLGLGVAGGAYWTGYMRDARIYSQVLTANQMATVYAAGPQ